MRCAQKTTVSIALTMAQPTGALSKWPITVSVRTAENGNAILPMDLFVGPAFKYSVEWARHTMPYRAYFNHCKRNGLVVTDHECTINNEAGRAAWLEQVNNDIFSNQFEEMFKKAYNDALREITSVAHSTAANSTGTYPYDCFLLGRRPTTQGDAKGILSSDEVVKRVRGGDYEEPMAALYAWCYYLSREGCNKKWASGATESYIKKRDWQVQVGFHTISGGKITTNAMERKGKKAATNAFQSGLRTMQERIWGVKLEINQVVDPASNRRTVDIGRHLPEYMRQAMGRRSGCVFNLTFINEGGLQEAEEKLANRTSELARWSHANNLGMGVVQRAVMASLGSVYGVPITRELEGAALRRSGGIIQPRQQIEGTHMAPRRRPDIEGVLRSTTTEASAAEGEEAGGAGAIEEQPRVVAELKDKEDDVAEAEAGEDDVAEADDISGKIFNVMDFGRDAASRRLQD